MSYETNQLLLCMLLEFSLLYMWLSLNLIVFVFSFRGLHGQPKQDDFEDCVSFQESLLEVVTDTM